MGPGPRAKMNPHLLDSKEAPTSAPPPLTFTQGLLVRCLARGDIQTWSEEPSGKRFLSPEVWGKPVHFCLFVEPRDTSLGKEPRCCQTCVPFTSGHGACDRPGVQPSQGALWMGGGGGGSEGWRGRGWQAQAEKLGGHPRRQTRIGDRVCRGQQGSQAGHRQKVGTPWGPR